MAGENQATAAVLLKDNAEEVKWLIQPECPVGSHCTWARFSREGWGLSKAEQGVTVAVMCVRQQDLGGQVCA